VAGLVIGVEAAGVVVCTAGAVRGAAGVALPSRGSPRQALASNIVATMNVVGNQRRRLAFTQNLSPRTRLGSGA
jgi:hypothetical protein